MFAWMIYAVLVSSALAGAALVAEKAAKHRRKSTRWPWMLALVASVLLPIAIATVSIQPSGVFKPATPVPAYTLREATSIPLASNVIDWSGATSYTSSRQVNTILSDIWLAVSLALTLFLALSTAWFHRRKRSWAKSSLCDQPVLVSNDVGPAVVGLFRSRIVIPVWVLDESPDQQRYVMAHERSHMAARDPLLVALALVLLVGMPWNPLLWWQFHRLRHAIEVDCDARVLGAGGDIGEYCETLIQVGQNRSGYVGAVTAMSESSSFLERRIAIMLSKPGKWAGATALAFTGLSLGMAVFAAQVTPPAASVPSANGAVSPSLLDDYAGFYELSDYSLVTVERKGSGLTITPIGQFLAQGTIDVSTVSDTVFSVPSIDVTMEFIKDAGNKVTSVTIREHGVVVMEAPRVDRATADRIRDGLATRVKEQKPYPDSEKALRLVLSNKQGEQGSTPMAARLAAGQHDSLEKYFAFLGPVESYKFEGVTDYGWDIYDVQHRNGAQQVFIQLDRNGLITNSVMRRQ